MNGDAADSYTFTVSGTGNFSGTTSAIKFTINPEKLNLVGTGNTKQGDIEGDTFKYEVTSENANDKSADFWLGEGATTDTQNYGHIFDGQTFAISVKTVDKNDVDSKAVGNYVDKWQYQSNRASRAFSSCIIFTSRLRCNHIW